MQGDNKFMRKDILLPGLAVGGGAVGFILRRWQWASAYDAESQLFQSGAASTLVLLGVLVLLSALLLVLSTGGAKPNEFLPAFFCPSSVYMAGMAASGFLFFGAGLLGLLSGMELLTLSRSVPDLVPMSYPLTHLLCALLCFPAGLSNLMLGKACYRQQLSSIACVFSSFPPLAGTIWLFISHRDHSTDPVLMGYGITLLAIALLTVAHYEIAACLFGRRHLWRATFCLLTGTLFALVSLADSPDRFSAVLTAAFTLSAMVQCHALLRSRFGPPYPRRLASSRMPSGAQDMEEADTTTDTDFDEGV